MRYYELTVTDPDDAESPLRLRVRGTLDQCAAALRYYAEEWVDLDGENLDEKTQHAAAIMQPFGWQVSYSGITPKKGS